jgi:CRP-like cAMP-binding protein
MAHLDLFKGFDNPVNFKQGETLLVDDAQGGDMYALCEGTVEIRAGEKLIATLGPGDFFGEMALINEHHRSGSVVASSDGSMVPITRDRFMFLVENHPFFALEVMRTLVDRLRAMNRAAQAKTG